MIRQLSSNDVKRINERKSEIGAFLKTVFGVLVVLLALLFWWTIIPNK